MNFRKFYFVPIFLILLCTFPISAEPLNVVVTIPDLGWVVQEIGKDEVRVKSLLKGKENPHFVDAVPKYIHWVADADAVCFAGLGLEVGWLPKVLSKSGNAKVQPGGKGYCETGSTVSVLEKPEGHVDRSMGDTHPEGNPHFWLSPTALSEASEKILSVLIDLRNEKASDFIQNQEELKKKLAEILQVNRQKLQAHLAKNKGPHFVQYHREFAYFARDYGLESLGAIEEKPGVSPSAGRLAKVALMAKSKGIRFALSADFDPQHTMMRFSEISGVPILSVPTMIQADSEWNTYPKLQDHLVSRILEILSGESEIE